MTFADILGRSPAMTRVREAAARAAAVDAPVLLTGETGTGKGLVARSIHQASPRARAAFVAVNCAGIAPSLFESEVFGHNRGAFTGAQYSHRGLFEQAHRGTLFLDEIGDLELPLQAKLLTALEDGEIRRVGAERTVRVDARFIAATGVDLARAVARRTFRQDLLHRLLVLPIHLPPLRERDGDIPLLVRHFVDRYARRYGRPVRGVDRSVSARLGAYHWPGNVRELDHVIHAAVLACDGGLIQLHHLPHTIEPASAPEPTQDTPYPDGRYSFVGSPEEERRLILNTLERCRGNRTRAARQLGMARNTLRNKIRSLGIDDRNSASRSAH
ncbi:MAG TPA: sigma-54 dependent transcriptional regulator [Longimicrobiales bacterium]|nr:sigma-54 dependent transcriptional regulator [Longimicrobiales bacterium]